MISVIPRSNCYRSGRANNPLFNVKHNFIHNGKYMYVAYSVCFHSVLRQRATYLYCAFPTSFFFFHLPLIVLIEVGVLPSFLTTSPPIGTCLYYFPFSFNFF